MPIKVDARTVGQASLENALREIGRLPRNIRKFRRSALSSTGFEIARALARFIRQHGPGAGWPQPHPLTVRFRSRFRRGKSKFTRRRGAFFGPVDFLANFTRWRTDKAATKVQVDFGRTKRGQPGKPDPRLVAIARRVQDGTSIKVTKKMRRFFATTKRKRTKESDIGVDFFPLSSETQRLIVPPRPIFDPFFEQVKPQIPAIFQRKLIRRIERFNREGK